MRLKGKKVVVLNENNYQDLGFGVRYYRLKEGGGRGHCGRIMILEKKGEGDGSNQ